MSRLHALLWLFIICYIVVTIVRFFLVMASAPRGSLSNALAEAEFDWAKDDEHNPILRDRRFAEARGDFLT